MLVPPGSSPLTRGKPRADLAASKAEGLIPAHAGKTRCQTVRFRRMRAHPRSRGENNQERSWTVELGGSSPLTRGKHGRVSCGGCREGLIPAHAGKTCNPPRRTAGGWAHPRSRGENWRMAALTAWLWGSSPLTRGKLLATLGDENDLGLIPAHAGKTLQAAVAVELQRAHPRSRGENAPVKNAVSLATGSSPLTRGKLAFQSVPCGECGLIPAHAGKTGR